MHRLRLLIASLAFLPVSASAHPVINEVLWPGSDLSTSDEWVEIFNPDASTVDVGNWTITSLNSKGEHVVEARFATGTLLQSGQYFVVARKSAASSRLLLEPGLLAPDLTLPNTNLLLKLRDSAGSVIDEVDDGSGVPFAGANPSGTGSKASMERIDPQAAGTLKENWRTAISISGLDDGAKVIATPGNPNSSPIVSSASSTGCNDTLDVGIVVQSGPLADIGKVTVNFQAVALAGTLGSSACSWEYGDGFTSSSCNPPSHSFTLAGTYTVRLQAKNQCGAVLTQEQTVQVFSDPSALTFASAFYDGSKLLLSAALPNPEGSDTGREWVEIRNPADTGVSLAGWKLKIGESPAKWVTLKGSIDADSVLRMYDSELKLSLPNAETLVKLVTPSGLELSSVEWKSAEEGREYYSSDLRKLRVRGRVVRVIGSAVLEVQLEPDAAAIAGTDHVFVRLLGITGLPLSDEEKSSERIDVLSDLSNGKLIELEFGSELWDSLGRLLAYVYTDQQSTLQEQLLLTGGWMVDRSLDFARKDQFLAMESPDIVASRITDTPAVAEVVTIEKTSGVRPGSDEWSQVFLSEIYASPDPQSKAQSGSLMAQEWLEFGSRSIDPVTLSGFVLQSGIKKKRLASGLFVSSGSLAFVSMSDLHLPLGNGGGLLTILDPNGTPIDSVKYPKLKYGQSYSRTGDSSDWCLSGKPTPGEKNHCTGNVPAKTAGKKPVSVRRDTSPAVSRYVADYKTRQNESSPVEYVVPERASASWSMLPVLISFVLGAIFSLIAAAVLLSAKGSAPILQKIRNYVTIET